MCVHGLFCQWTGQCPPKVDPGGGGKISRWRDSERVGVRNSRIHGREFERASSDAFTSTYVKLPRLKCYRFREQGHRSNERMFVLPFVSDAPRLSSYCS